MQRDLALPPLINARVHEAEGAGRRLFGLLQAACVPASVVWVVPAHVSEQLLIWGMPPGLAARLHLVRAASEADLLWAAEEALRSPAVGMVVAEPEKPLSLTAGRRLQLAAEAGRTTGIMLVHEGAGSNATETRWHCAPLGATTADSTLHQWGLIKNKKGTLGSWVLRWDGTSRPLFVVSAAGERPRPADASL